MSNEMPPHGSALESPGCTNNSKYVSFQCVPRKYPRRHGCQLPIHPAQILTAIHFMGVYFILYAVVIPTSPTCTEKICLAIVGIIIILVQSISWMCVSIINPEVPGFPHEKYKKEVEELDMDQFQFPIIQNNFCYLCQITVDRKTDRHCYWCNRCTHYIDHHCVIYNNCVAYKNYSYFLLSIYSSVFLLVFVSGLSILAWCRNLQQHWNFLFFYKINSSIYFVILVVSSISFSLEAFYIFNFGQTYFRNYKMMKIRRILIESNVV